MTGNISDKPHILVVDDDDRLRALLKKFLSEQGFMVTVAAGTAEARRILAWFTPDAIVLDVMMPGETGLQFLASLPAEKRPPALMLSAMGESDDRINGLEIGADDYLVKPFEPKELVLRLKAVLRRSKTQSPTTKTVRFGDFAFSPTSAQLTAGEAPVYLTSSEAQLLKLLSERCGQPVAREELARLMGAANERSVDVQVTRLRKKIEASAGRPVYLQTVRGAGYVLYASEG